MTEIIEQIKKVGQGDNMAQILTEELKVKNLLKRIGKTGKINNNDAEYIRRHYQYFRIPMFVRKKR